MRGGLSAAGLCFGLALAATPVIAAAPALQTEPPRGEHAGAKIRWASTPSAAEMQKAYPARALDRGVGGLSAITCKIAAAGDLTDCRVASEAPEAYGFGKASLAIARRFRLAPESAAALRGGGAGSVTLPIRWIAERPEGGFFAVIWGLVFAALFIGAWLAVSSLLTGLSGWFALARRYPDHDQQPLLSLPMQSGAMGRLGKFNGVLTLSACPSGLRVSVLRVFAPFAQPFLVPWSEIEVQPIALFWLHPVRLSFGKPEMGSLTISEAVWDRLSGAAGR
jgi:TonB family protein